MIPRKLTSKELKDIHAFRAPIHQHLFALENIDGIDDGGITELYLIHDNTLIGVEKSFIDFLLTEIGQEVVVAEGFLSPSTELQQ